MRPAHQELLAITAQATDLVAIEPMHINLRPEISLYIKRRLRWLAHLVAWLCDLRPTQSDNMSSSLPVISFNLLLSSLNRLPVIGWSGPAGGTLDLSWTIINRSRISLSSSRYDRKLASLHVGVWGDDAETVSSVLGPLVSASGDDGGETGESERFAGDESITSPGAPLGSTGETSIGDSKPRL